MSLLGDIVVAASLQVSPKWHKALVLEEHMLKKQKQEKEDEEKELFPRILDANSDTDRRFQEQEKERLKHFSKFHKRNRQYIQNLDNKPLTQ